VQLEISGLIVLYVRAVALILIAFQLKCALQDSGQRGRAKPAKAIIGMDARSPDASCRGKQV